MKKLSLKRVASLLIAIILAMPVGITGLAEEADNASIYVTDEANSYVVDDTIVSADDVDPEVGETNDLELGGEDGGMSDDDDAVTTYWFLVNDELYSEQTVGEGEAIQRPEDPEIPEGMFFSGWFLEDGTQLFADNTTETAMAGASLVNVRARFEAEPVPAPDMSSDEEAASSNEENTDDLKGSDAADEGDGPVEDGDGSMDEGDEDTPVDADTIGKTNPNMEDDAGNAENSDDTMTTPEMVGEEGGEDTTLGGGAAPDEDPGEKTANPEKSESDENADGMDETALHVHVAFTTVPEEAVVTVFTAITEENPEPEPIPAQEDGSFLLLPGKYTYGATAEGYVAVDGIVFTVAEEALTIAVSLEPAVEAEKEAAEAVVEVAEDAVSVEAANGVDDQYTITIEDGITGGTVTASPTSAVEDGTVTLTIEPDTGYALATLTVGGTEVTAYVNNNAYTFTMPTSDVTVSAAFTQPEVEYIDFVNGVATTKTIPSEDVPSYTLLTGGSNDSPPTKLSGGWYVAEGKISYPGGLSSDEDVHLILTNNCELTVGGGYYYIDYDYSTAKYGINSGMNLTVYGQAAGSEEDKPGKLTAKGGENGINAKNLTVNGGALDISGTGENVGMEMVDEVRGINAKNMTVNGGTLNVSINGQHGDAIVIEKEFKVTGGTISAKNMKLTDMWESDVIKADSVDISGGTVTAVVDCSYGGNGIYATKSIGISGGTVTVNIYSLEGSGLTTYSNLSITGGSVTVNGADESEGYGICAENVSITGGKVDVSVSSYSYGIVQWTNGSIILDWTNADDFIKASNYNVNEGCWSLNLSLLKPFYNGMEVIPAGTVTDRKAINGKKLEPVNVIAAGASNGSVETNVRFAAVKDPITVTATPKAGYVLEALSYQVGEADPVNIPCTLSEGVYTGTFEMPEGIVTVSAVFSHSVTLVQPAHGAISADVAFAAKGDTVTLTATPDVGYALSAWNVTDADNQAVIVKANNTFTMPDANVTVSATFSEWKWLQNQLAAGGTVKLKKDYKDTLGEGPLVVSSRKTVTLDLNGHVIDRALIGAGKKAQEDGNVITVKGTGSLTVEDSRPDFEGTEAEPRAAVSYTDPTTNTTVSVKGGVITGGNNTSYGGGVYSEGAFTMSSGSITGNTAPRGGGVYVGSNGTLTMTDGSIAGNTASLYGGGVYERKGGTFTMKNGSITGNTASSNFGGGVYVGKGTFTMDNGSITNNSSSVYGGGVHVSEGTFTMNNGSITNNSTSDKGGGVYVGEGTFTMNNGSITNNSSSDKGGGIYVNTGKISVYGAPVISGNTTNSSANNVYLPNGKTINIPENTTLTSAASIGVSMDSPGTFTSGLSGNGAAANFQSDDTRYGVRLNGNGEAELAKQETLKINTRHGKVTAKVNDTEVASGGRVFAGDTVALTITPDAGYTLISLTLTDADGKAVTVIAGNTFSVPDKDVTVSAVFLKVKNVTYINADGNSATHDAYVLEGGLTTLPGGWYAVEGTDVSYPEGMTFTGDANLILADGYKLTAGSAANGNNFIAIVADNYGEPKSLNVYGQSGQSGELIAVSDYIGISAGLVVYGGNIKATGTTEGGIISGSDSVAIYGGNVSATGKTGIFGAFGITVTGGTVTANGTDFGLASNMGNISITGGTVTANGVSSVGINGFFSVSITGGTVTANGTCGVYANENGITLGWTNPGDSITASSWGGTISVQSGKILRGSNGKDYIDEITEYAELAGVTLIPANIFIEASDGGCVTADKYYAPKDTLVTLTVTPAKGFILDTLTVKNANYQNVGLSGTGSTRTFTMPAGNVTVTATFIMDWPLLQEQFRLGGTIKLEKDYTCVDQSQGPLFVPSGKRVTLDLNGHVIDRGLTSARKSGNVITVSSGGSLTVEDGSPSTTHDGTGIKGGIITGGNNSDDLGGGGVIITGGEFIMKGGSITDNSAEYAGGVLINGGTFSLCGGSVTGNNAGSSGGGVLIGEGTFSMSSGSITGNSTEYGGGGGVIMFDGTFSLSGGEITGNTAATSGGGVYVDTGTFKLSGAPTITGNRKGDANNNVYLWDGEPIIIDDTLTSAASIGVSMYYPGTFTSGLSGNGAAANFQSDDTRYGVRLNGNGEAELAKQETLKINTRHGKVTAKVNDTEVASGGRVFAGDTVALTITPDAGYTLISLTLTDADGKAVTVIAGNTFSVPDKDVTVSAVFLKVKNVTYINADGNSATHDAYVLEGGLTTLPGGWYVVEGTDVSCPEGMTFTGDANLILADGYKLTAGSADDETLFVGLLARDSATSTDHDLTVYGQTGQSGKLIATGKTIGMQADDIAICGGEIEATGVSPGYYGLCGTSSVSIARGSVTARGGNGIGANPMAGGGQANVTITGGTVDAASTGDNGSGIIGNDRVIITGGTVNATGKGGYYGIQSNGDVSVTGGKVTTNCESGGHGIYSMNGNISLGWMYPTDNIKASSYHVNTDKDKTLSVQTGKYLRGDNSEYYSGDITDKIGNLANVTLTPANIIVSADEHGSVVPSYIANGQSAANPYYAPEGTKVTMTATPADDYVLSALTVKDASGTVDISSDGSFTMPAGNVNVKATFNEHTHSFDCHLKDGATLTGKCSAGNCPLNGREVTLTIVAMEGELVYDGTAKPATVTGDTLWLVVPDIVYTKDGVAFDGIPTDAGEYVASLTLGGTVATVTYIIGKFSIEASDLTAAQKPAARTGLTANGTNQPLVTKPKALPNGYTIVWYSIDGGKTWADAVPVARNAGSYTVRVKYVGDANHADFEGDVITVTIAKAADSQPSTATVTTPGAPVVVPAPSGPTITIPKAPASVKAKAKKSKVTVSWKKIKKTKKTKVLLNQIKGIEVQYSTDPSFTTDVNTRNIGKKKTKVTLKLQKKMTYYIRVRYTDGAGGVSNWSAVRKEKTK